MRINVDGRTLLARNTISLEMLLKLGHVRLACVKNERETVCYAQVKLSIQTCQH